MSDYDRKMMLMIYKSLSTGIILIIKCLVGLDKYQETKDFIKQDAWLSESLEKWASVLVEDNT